MNAQYGCEILIVGAGITGLAIARELLQRGAEDILIIEKEAVPGFHASGRNSGVLHAGIYYTPDTLKAKFCIEGNRLMKAYCREKGLTLGQTGKVVVARDETEVPGLYELKKRADACGATSAIIDAKELSSIEPFALTFEKALFSPETAVFRPLEIVDALARDLTGSRKVRISYRTAFLRPAGSSTVLTSSGQIRFERLINAAGAYADRIAHQFGVAGQYTILPFKGTYKKLNREKRFLVRGNIYPVPDLRNPFLGVHFTHTADDQVFIGPTAIPALGRENYRMFDGWSAETPRILWREGLLFFRDPVFRYSAAEEIKKYSSTFVYRESCKLLKGLGRRDIEDSDKTGIRAQLVDRTTGRLEMDFVVIKDSDSLHVLNAVSPAFTSSMAFARAAADQILTPAA